MDKVDSKQEQMDKLSKEMDILRKNKKETLEIDQNLQCNNKKRKYFWGTI